MARLLYLCILSILVGFFKVSEEFAVCGDSYKQNEADKATDQIISRLMAFRKPDWGWEFASTASTLQATVPKRFFGRHRTAKALKAAIVAGAKKMTIRALAENAIAANALCLNERNIGGIDLIKQIDDRLKQHFPGKRRIPKEGYWMYSIGIAALCICGYPVKPYIVNKLLEGQNENGSFGDSDHIGHTAALMPPMQCLKDIPSPLFNVTLVDHATRKMREFIISNVIVREEGKVYVGSEIVSELALIGLWKTREPNENMDRWLCRNASLTLGIFPRPGEDEPQLGMRLLRLHAGAYIDMAPPGYECLKSRDAVPRGYKPTCNHAIPETCQSDKDPKK